MHISAKTEYACLAVLELAAQFESVEPMRIRSIADAHGIPPRFLVQILLQLKAAGLVSSTRGAAGGYQLVKHPSAITLGDVMAAIDGSAADATAGAAGQTPTCRVLRQAWQEVADVQRKMLNSTTFAELLDRASARSDPMYYI